ncbi:MAG TPA: hypothetical protein VJ953_16595 [Saprospiraceae bacterium]|nr:hypothetical protein [Saprospiraceae bacterium]
MKKLSFLLILSFFLAPSLIAQGNQNEVSEALAEFMQTEFMRKFNDLRVQAETEVNAFRANSAQYDPQQVARVRVAYDQTAQRFNGLLNKIKMDFLDRQKLKYITQYPETYSRGLELDIRELSDFYSQNLQQTLADVTNNQQDGSALLILLIDLVKFSSSAIQHFKRIRSEARRYTDSYLNTHFVQPNHFKNWSEISNRGYNDPYQQPSDPYNDPYNQNPNDPYSDPYQQNPTNPYNDPYNQNQNTDPYNQNQTDPYNNPYQQNQNTNPYQQNQTDPYNNPYNQTQNTNPYQQNNGYNFDGSQRVDSLKPYWPPSGAKPDSLHIPKKPAVDSSKIKKTKVNGSKKS